MKIFEGPQSQKLISVQGGFFLGNWINVHCTFIRDIRVLATDYSIWSPLASIVASTYKKIPKASTTFPQKVRWHTDVHDIIDRPHSINM